MKDGVLWPSGALGGTPNDESNDNAGHSQQHKQDANLLPGALLKEGGGTGRWLAKTDSRQNINSDRTTATTPSCHQGCHL